jgi:hypothetical protein
MRNATKVTVSTFGVLAGLGGYRTCIQQEIGRKP